MASRTLCTRLLAPVLAAVATLAVAAPAWAEEAVAASGHNPQAGLMTLALALGVGLAAIGGSFGQSRALAAALDGIARNPNAADKLFVPMILGLVFIESLTLFTWVLMFLLRNNI